MLLVETIAQQYTEVKKELVRLSRRLPRFETDSSAVFVVFVLLVNDSLLCG